MVDAHIADGDIVLMEPIYEPSRLKNGSVVSAMVPGSGTTLKYFYRNRPIPHYIFRSAPSPTLQFRRPSYAP